MPPEDSSGIKSQGGRSQETTEEKQRHKAAQHIIVSPAAGHVGYPRAASARGPGTDLVSV